MVVRAIERGFWRKYKKAMSKTIIVLAILFVSNLSNAQERVLLNVTYEFRYVRDLANPDAPYETNMTLSLGKHSSRYCTQKLYYENSDGAKHEREKQQENISAKPLKVVSGGPLLLVNKHGAIINEEIIKDISARKLTVNAVLGIKAYEMEIDLPKINWDIQDENKVIGDYTCQKALGEYGGRTYEVWFTPDLLFQDGPWKLSGLPGLILEARDTRNEVSFLFKELSRTSGGKETTASLLNHGFSIQTNVRAFNKAKKAFETDPESVMAAQAPNATVAVKNIDAPDATAVVKIKKYNPMELD